VDPIVEREEDERARCVTVETNPYCGHVVGTKKWLQSGIARLKCATFFPLGWTATESTERPTVPAQGQSMERVTGKTEVLGQNLPQCRFVHHKSHTTYHGVEQGAAAVGSR
jgi:hypothetical protein